MSVKVMGRVWDLDLPHNKLLVLLALADHADHEGNNVFPSLGLVAWKTGYSQQQCRRVMSELEKDGILIATQRRQGFKTVYRIDVNKGKQKEAYTPSKMSPLPKSNPNPLHFDHSTPNMPSLKKEHEPSLEPSIEPNTRADAQSQSPNTSRTAQHEHSTIKEVSRLETKKRSEKSPKTVKGWLTRLSPVRAEVIEMLKVCYDGWDNAMMTPDNSLTVHQLENYITNTEEYIRLGGKANEVGQVYEYVADLVDYTIAPKTIAGYYLRWKASKKAEDSDKADKAYESAKAHVETLMTDEQRKKRAEQMKADRIAIFGEKTA